MNIFLKYFLIFNLLVNISYAQENEEEKKVNEEKKDQSIDYKIYNVRLSPLSLLIGSISGTADIKIKDNLTVGPSLSIWSLTVGTTKASSFSFGAEANYATNGDIGQDGWIGTAFASYGTFSIEETYSSNIYEGSMGILSLGGTYGYQWMWEKFNIQAGLGLNYYLADSTISVETSSGQTRSISNPVGSGISLALKFTLGWKL